MDCGRTHYDYITYEGTVIPNTSPSHLTLCSLWHHGSRPPLQHFHLVELGCGSGANLLPLAFYDSESTFIGIDNSKKELERARKGARYLGIENISFMLKDVRDLYPKDFVPCDYIIAHGLYSWVPEDARQAILTFCRQNLTPSGLSYISYNAQPGWAMRRLVRETLLRARSVRKASIEDKAKSAIEVATHLLEDLPSRDNAFAFLLAEELERVRDGKPGYVFHEYLAEVNEGFWLMDFIEQARSKGLDCVADAQFCRCEGHIPEGLKASLAKRDLDLIEQEEATDLLGHRYFRASILCLSEAPREIISQKELLEEVHISTPLYAQSDPFDLTEGIVERFSGKNGFEVTLDESITKAAVILLAAQWPIGMRLKELYFQASNLLATQGFVISTSAESQLSDQLIKLFETGQIDFRLKEPMYHQEIPGYPKTHVLAQFEALHRETLTTPYHLSIPFDPPGLALIRALNGSRSQAELGQVFGEKFVNQTLNVLGRWGLLECSCY